MKQNKCRRLALGLSVLLHVLLLIGIAWLSPFAALKQPIASLELDLITTTLAQAEPHFSSPVAEVSIPTLNDTAITEPSIPCFLDNQIIGSTSSEIAMKDSTIGNVKAFAGPTLANKPGGGTLSAETQTSAAAFHPQLLHKVEPLYPEEARRQRMEGRVVIRLEVLTNGLAGLVTIRQSSGQQLLDEAAVEAVKKWRFIPAKDARGTPVLSFTIVPVAFQLK